MEFEALDKKLDAICTEYDYGIVPNSVTVFVRDRLENFGQLELTLLEGILVIIDAFRDGFKVSSCSPLLDAPSISASLDLVQSYQDVTFDTMERLLMTISPLFAQRLLDKIHTNLSPTALPQTLEHTNPTLSNGDMFEWIH